MKLSKDEMIQKVNEKVMDEDVKIELMEDITDSLEVNDNSESEKITELEQRINELEEKNKNLTEKYKERFLKGSEKEDEPEENGLEEKNVIDIKEI